MPHRSWIDDDFAAFRASLLSLTPSVPLQLNLRAIVAPALEKLLLYSKATVAFHFFTNPRYREIQVLTIGAGRATALTLASERERRRAGADFVPSEDLPSYYSPEDPRLRDNVERLFKLPRISRDEEYKGYLAGPLLAILKELAQDKKYSAEFAGRTPCGQDLVIVLPLRNAVYPTLGHFVLWSPGDELCSTSESTTDREIRSTFEARMRQLIVRLFTNYYKMGRGTYLPSYYLPGRKKVALLSAEIGGFHRIWDQVRSLNLPQEEKTSARLDLVDNFGRIAAEAIEKSRGRIDQNWGSGVLGVFGEYPEDPNSSPSISLTEALTASQVLVEKFADFARRWKERNFKEDPTFVPTTTPMVGIGIHWAHVLFDYFGSADHRTFLGVGDNVSLIKALASTAGTSRRFRDKPILLHQSAMPHAVDIVQNAAVEELQVPGVADPIPVYPISKENLLLSPD
jgi:class 3 adenylate cyclase